MKTRIIILTILIAALMQGCLVKSLHPFYTKKDLVLEKELFGDWTDKDSGRWTIHQHTTGFLNTSKPDSSYDITYTDNQGSSKFQAHLFRLGGQLYLDFYPTDVKSGSSLEDYHLIAAHTLARVSLSKNVIIIRWYNEEWLAGLFNKNRVRIAHERIPYDPDKKDSDSYQVILTAPTAELQDFIRKYGNDPDAFRKKKSDPDYAYTFILTRTL
jgi:hypothetical protein